MNHKKCNAHRKHHWEKRQACQQSQHQHGLTDHFAKYGKNQGNFAADTQWVWKCQCHLAEIVNFGQSVYHKEKSE